MHSRFVIRFLESGPGTKLADFGRNKDSGTSIRRGKQMLHGRRILLLSHNRHGFANSLAISKNAHSRVKKGFKPSRYDPSNQDFSLAQSGPYRFSVRTLTFHLAFSAGMAVGFPRILPAGRTGERKAVTLKLSLTASVLITCAFLPHPSPLLESGYSSRTKTKLIKGLSL